MGNRKTSESVEQAEPAETELSEQSSKTQSVASKDLGSPAQSVAPESPESLADANSDSPAASETAPTSPSSPAEVEDSSKLDRIRYLVDQSKLYAQFLSSNLEAPTTELDLHECRVPHLHQHQKLAVKWMLNLYQNGLNGILADEMGLGKTLSTIAFLSYLQFNGIDGPFLIVAPLSTVGNWVRELEVTPHLQPLGYYGPATVRKGLRSRLSKAKLVITSYEILMKDARFLRRAAWKYIIVDEGHRLKNVNCKLMKQLKQFNSANRMLLTGTPLQNNLTELWALLNFLMPDVFTDIDIFHTWFEQGFAIDTEAEGSLVESLHSILRPFMLRRLKSEVNLELPPKREYAIYCGMQPEQAELYQQIIDGNARDYVMDLVASSAKRQKTTSSKAKVQVQVDQVKYALRNKSFNFMMMQLRQACNSPFLFYTPYYDGEVDERIESSSGKLTLLWQLLQRLDGHKTLIFSQFTGMLDIIEDWAAFRNLKTCRIDGSTAQADRVEIMDEFNTDPDTTLFLLSTRSGGQGINLIAADTVILFDSDWNPHQDLQAMDRVHRIGQTKPVLVFRFIVGDTVEQTMLEKARAKLEFGEVVIEQAKLNQAKQEEQMAEIKRQFAHHRAIFNNTAQLSENDLAKMLDRSPEAYKIPEVDNPNVYVL